MIKSRDPIQRIQKERNGLKGLLDFPESLDNHGKCSDKLTNSEWTDLLAWKLGWPLKRTFIDNFDITGLDFKFSLFFHYNFVFLNSQSQ